jgi:hypothetical protein
MKGKRFVIGFAVLAITASAGSMADGIYKWTDAQGNVHYEDRPTGSSSERMKLTYRRTNSAALQQRIQTHVDSETARKEARSIAAEEAKSADAAAAEAAAKQKKCETYRERMQTLTQSRRVYRQGEDGEREYLDEKELQKTRQRVEDMIAENCSS